jgi:hypothetical protein
MGRAGAGFVREQALAAGFDLLLQGWLAPHQPLEKLTRIRPGLSA